MRYAIGSRVRVQVSRVDLDGRRIDFRLVNENDGLGSRPPRDKDLPREREESGDATQETSANPRRRRKISEPLARTPQPASQPSKPAAKSKDKARKPRRRT